MPESEFTTATRRASLLIAIDKFIEAKLQFAFADFKYGNDTPVNFSRELAAVEDAKKDLLRELEKI